MPKLEDLDPRLQAAINTVTGMRPRRVIDHILAHGSVTTEDLEAMGYKHAPRAARDVRECGVPLVTARVTGATGKSIGSHTFGDPGDVERHKLGGRVVLPKELRDRLVELQGGRCAICHHKYEARYFQVDHRVPYEVAGESADPSETDKFMALCASCQRKKSWSCEQCDNWSAKVESTCSACFWVDPVSYTHVAMEQVRSLSLTFARDDAATFDHLRTKYPGGDLADAAREAILALADPHLKV